MTDSATLARGLTTLVIVRNRDPHRQAEGLRAALGLTLRGGTVEVALEGPLLTPLAERAAATLRSFHHPVGVEAEAALARAHAVEVWSDEPGPRAASADLVPRAASADLVPRAASADRVPQTASADRVPQTASADRVPQTASADRVPRAASADRVPQTASADRVPRAASADRVPRPPSADRVPLLAAASHRPPAPTSRAGDVDVDVDVDVDPNVDLDGDVDVDPNVDVDLDLDSDLPSPHHRRTILHLVRTIAPPHLSARDWVVYLEPGPALRLADHGAPPLPAGPIDHDQLVLLLAAAELAVTW